MVQAPAGTSAAAFDKYVLTVCLEGMTADCPTHDCTPVSGDATPCAIDGLLEGQTYNVWVVAVKGAASSLPSSPVTIVAQYP